MTAPSVAVFLKAPRPGQVKTRLAAALGASAAAALYRDLASDTLEWAAAVPRARKFLYYSPADGRDECARLGAASRFSLRPQDDGDLGERLATAFEDLIGRRGAPAVVIGSDCPLLDERYVRAAIAALARRDVVLGPARDGGYCLVGLRRPAPDLFRSIPWSTEDVLERTLARARAGGLSVELLAPLSDVDRPDDLVELRRELLQAWWETAQGRRRAFPRRTFRRLCWELPSGGPRRLPARSGNGR